MGKEKSDSKGTTVDRDYKVVVIDNGGGSLKVGLAGSPNTLRVLPNYIAKPKTDKKSYFGDQVNEIKDVSSINLKRPIEKGYVTNWDLLREIWTHVFKYILKVDTQQCRLIVTEPLFNLPALQTAMEELVFKEFGFVSVVVLTAPQLSLVHQLTQHAGALPPSVISAQCGLVLDCGFSFTHAVPIFDGKIIWEGVRRINLGGKALTNYMKELVSFRAWNMMDEFLIIDDAKEKLSFVSQDLKQDLETARLRGSDNSVRRFYVLPDGIHHTRGYVKELDQAGVQNELKRKKPDDNKDEEQLLTLTNERFIVPECLFHPSDIGLNQAGLAETLISAVSSLPPEVQELLFSNVLCTGGCASIPGFVDRLYSDLRPLVSSEYELKIRISSCPVESAWHGGVAIATSDELARLAVTQEMHKKMGTSISQSNRRLSCVKRV